VWPKLSSLLSHPAAYHYLRQILTGGIPFRRFVRLCGLDDPSQRIADLGCGPADVLRYVHKDRKAQFYLGVDLSQCYLDAARGKARRAGMDAEVVALDLERLPHDAQVREQLLALLDWHRITRVLLLGVLHHIDDEAVTTTLDLTHRASTVQSLVTCDVVRVAGCRLNNFLCDHDCGHHVRDERGYDALAARSPWKSFTKFWSSPRFSFIKYIHYEFRKGDVSDVADEQPAEREK